MTGPPGGCLYAKGDADLQGTIKFIRCAAAGDGGAVAARSVVSSAHATFHSCKANGPGGLKFRFSASIFSYGRDRVALLERNRNLSWPGGAVRTNSSFLLQGGALTFHACFSQASGGGVSVGGNFTQQGGLLELVMCSAVRDGGGLEVSEGISLNGISSFRVCTAGGWAPATRACLGCIAHCCPWAPHCPFRILSFPLSY